MANPKIGLPKEVKSLLDKAQDGEQRTVVMTCGLSGSGKSTLARNIEAQYPSYVRLSIDKNILRNRGIYGHDYPASKLDELQDEAQDILNAELKILLGTGNNDIVIDLSFYSRADRDEYRGIIKREGKGAYQVILIVFRGDEESLWKRIEGRRAQNQNARDAGEGYEGLSIDRGTLRTYLEGFEWPDGEGEVVLMVE